jgi:RimJ/RimL family protein N-acetyltransferase
MIDQQMPSAPGLRLRRWRTGDLPALVRAHQDPLMRRYLGTHVPDLDAGRHWLAAQEAGWAAGTRLAFAVVGEEDGALLGHVVVKRLEPESSVAEVGYWTAPEARGRGVASAAVRAVTAWVADLPRPTPLERIELIHDVGNAGSCAVARACGYPLEAELPAHPPRWPSSGHRHAFVLPGR